MSHCNWKLQAGQQAFWQNKKVRKVQFPEFWEISKKEKGEFFVFVSKQAQNFVEETGRGKEYLVEDLVHHFWHEHCDFCTNKITADMNVVAYCTEDFLFWMCADCFEEFQKELNVTVENI